MSSTDASVSGLVASGYTLEASGSSSVANVLAYKSEGHGVSSLVASVYILEANVSSPNVLAYKREGDGSNPRLDISKRKKNEI